MNFVTCCIIGFFVMLAIGMGGAHSPDAETFIIALAGGTLFIGCTIYAIMNGPSGSPGGGPDGNWN